MQRREDNIKMDIRVVRCSDVYLFHLSKDGVQWRAVLDTVLKLSVP